MEFMPERLAAARKKLGINKAEAAKLLNMSAMGYGRYERGERTPSYQTVQFIAEKFGVSYEYLTGAKKTSAPDRIVVIKKEDPELFALVDALKDCDEKIFNKVVEYYNKLV
ncbi:MAG: helix-turn-helix domain-containing protein [Lachnospiraceae bacterium]|nr:helix-turn-helix domain-containing protein [Lachnospiraceae bacterium]